MMTGGWLTIWYCPPASSPSLDSACKLSRVCAFAAVCCPTFSARLASFSCSSFPFFPFAPLTSLFVLATALRSVAISSSSSRWEYQMSIVGIFAKSAMASR
jgi:hypothetical protein